MEIEVISLFDQFRGRLLGYVLSFGLTLHDGEEVIQEVFLALFLHLRREKSRKNLPGWLFRAAHNLALKRCCANRQARGRVDWDESIVLEQRDAAPSPKNKWPQMSAPNAYNLDFAVSLDKISAAFCYVQKVCAIAKYRAS